MPTSMTTLITPAEQVRRKRRIGDNESTSNQTKEKLVSKNQKPQHYHCTPGPQEKCNSFEHHGSNGSSHRKNDMYRGDSTDRNSESSTEYLEEYYDTNFEPSTVEIDVESGISSSLKNIPVGHPMLCWRCGNVGHRRFECSGQKQIFCSRCGRIGVMSCDCACEGKIIFHSDLIGIRAENQITCAWSERKEFNDHRIEPHGGSSSSNSPLPDKISSSNGSPPLKDDMCREGSVGIKSGSSTEYLEEYHDADFEPSNAEMDVEPGDSPILQKTPVGNTMLCWRCGKVGHRRSKCNRRQQIFCSRCIKIGVVMSRDCSCEEKIRERNEFHEKHSDDLLIGDREPPPELEEDAEYLPVHKTKLCWRCGHPGHDRDNCSGVPRLFCSRCGRVGIMSRWCDCKLMKNRL